MFFAMSTFDNIFFLLLDKCFAIMFGFQYVDMVILKDFALVGLI